MSALDYDKKRHYSISIIKTIQRVVGATADGKWGPQTVEHVKIWQSHHGLKPDGKVGRSTLKAILHAAGGHDDAPHHHHGGGHQDPPNASGTIRHVGVWTTASSLGHNAARHVKFCKDHNINRLDVFVNTVPKHGVFHTHDVGEIADLCKRGTDAGMEVHLTSWIVPDATFIDDAAERLIPLCKQVGARSLVWDAEEPWNRHKGGLPFPEAADKVASAFASLSCPMSASGIINTPTSKFGPLAKKCEYMVPQCYATSRNNLDPKTIVGDAVSKWREEFAHDKKFIIGLAAYRQTIVDGMDTREAMIASLDNVCSLGIDTVSYWSLPSIMESPVVAGVISEILRPR